MTVVPTIGPLPVPPHVCTGLTARWCPVHGDCLCATFEGDDADYLGDAFSGGRGHLDDPACPLHRPDSTHAEGITT